MWTPALCLFIAAALTGVFFRFGTAYGLTLGLNIGNVRHAHSHLMYFGWVTPLLMGLLIRHFTRPHAAVQVSVLRIVYIAFSCAVLAYPFFLLYGYRPAVIAGRSLPLSVIAAGLNVIAWYGFVLYYRKYRQHNGARAGLFADTAVIFLLFSTLGAWGLALMKPLGITDVAAAVALTHVFLDVFTEGWLVLGVLALYWVQADPLGEKKVDWSLAVLCLGVPAVFALGMPSSLVHVPLAWLGRVAGFLIGLAILVNVGKLVFRHKGSLFSMKLVPLWLLGIKGVSGMVASATPGFWPADFHGLRILYLHVTLFGFVTLGLISHARLSVPGIRPVAYRLFVGSVLLVLLSLIPTTGFWPLPLDASYLKVQAWAALLPVVMALGLVRRTFVREKSADNISMLYSIVDSKA